ncbi:MAG: hypothetical protein V3V01_09650 [Acidimicrobiales bacterium]
MSTTETGGSVYLEASVRSPIGLSHGALSGWHPVDLLSVVVEQLLEISGTAIDEIDRVLLGNATPVGALWSVGRGLAVASGWPGNIEVTEVSAGRASGHRALALASELVASGAADRVVVATIDMASLVPPGAPLLRRDYGKPWGPAAIARFGNDGDLPDGPFADALAIDRDAQDRYVLNQHLRAQSWRASASEIQSRRLDSDRGVAVPGAMLTRDGAVRGDQSLAALGELSPMFDVAGTVTAASLSQAGDGAVAILVSSEPSHWQIGTTVSRASLPTDPFLPLFEAWRVDDQHSGVIGLSETSAAHVLAASQGLDIDIERVNPHGGALARGRLDGGESLATLHDLTAAEGQQFETVTLATLSGDGAALVTDLVVRL